MIVNCPAKFHNEKILKKYCTVSKTVRTGMVRHLRILLRRDDPSLYIDWHALEGGIGQRVDLAKSSLSHLNPRAILDEMTRAGIPWQRA